MLLKRYIFSVFCLLSFSVSGKYIPEDFKHFYEYKKNEILFQLPNDVEEYIIVESNVENIKKIISVDKLKNAMKEAGIKSEKQAELLREIITKNNVEGVTIVYDANNQSLSLSVPASYMSSEKHEQDFTNAKPDKNAIISGNRVYTNGYNGDYTASLTNDTTIGLNQGHVSFVGDVNYSDQSTDFNVQDLNYAYDFKGASFQVGYAEYSNSINNATSKLDMSQGSEVYSISLFSNDNLLVKDVRNTKKMYFDMRAAGTVELIRDGVTIYTNSVGKGQQTIEYNRIPKGNYSAELVLKPNGFTKEVYQKRINNNNSETSERGYDYSFSVNQAKSSRGDNDYESTYFDMSGIKSLFSNNFLVGSSMQASENDFHIGLGGEFRYSNYSAGIYINHLGDGNVFKVEGDLYGVSFDYESLNLDENVDVSDLTGARYGDNDYQQSTISYSTDVGIGNLTLYANKYIEESRFNNHNIENLNVSANLHTTILKNIAVDLGYSINRDMTQGGLDEQIITTNFSIPLSNSFEYTTGFDYSSLTGSRLSNTAQYNDDVYEENDMKVTAGANVSQYIDGADSEASIGGDVTANGKHYNANMYANVSDDHYRNISANFESTAIVVGGDFYATSDRSKSYLIVNNNVAESDIDESDLGIVGAQSLSGNSVRESLSDQYTLVGLDDYSQYKFNLDTEVSGFQSDKSRSIGSMYSYPGTVKSIDNKVKKVVTFLTYFEDFNSSPLNDVDCIGDGCVSISKVGDGVYSISVTKEEPFKITSNNQVCIFGEEVQANTHSVSRCFPRIKEESSGLQLVESGLGDDGDVIYYLGVMDNDMSKEFRDKLKGKDIELIKFDFNNNNHIFAKLLDSNSKNEFKLVSQMKVIQEIQQYASIEKASEQFTSIR